MQVGIIGGGAICQFLLEIKKKQNIKNLTFTSVFVRDEKKYAHLKKYGVKLFTNFESFLNEPNDLIVEAATVEAVKEYIPLALQKKDIVLISIGALVDESFYEQLLTITKEKKRSLYLPSGAIGGLDLLQNAKSINGVETVTLTTRKPAHTLVEETLTKEKTIFTGSARKAIKQFPKNVNVAIVLSLAGIGMDKTRVNVIADPYTTKNSHEISITGAFGKAKFTIENNPLPTNPKTSYLAAISVLNACLNQSKTIQIG